MKWLKYLLVGVASLSLALRLSWASTPQLTTDNYLEISSQTTTPYLVQHPDIGKEIAFRSFLKGVVYFAEGVYPNAYDMSPYEIINGYTRLDSFADHPRIDIPIRGTNLTSDAAGSCQFISTTWDGLQSQYPEAFDSSTEPFSPQNQDRGCAILLMQTGVYEKLMTGVAVNNEGFIVVDVDRFTEAVAAGCSTWASFPGIDGRGCFDDAEHGYQKAKPIEDLWQNFLKVLAEKQTEIDELTFTKREKEQAPLTEPTDSPESKFTGAFTQPLAVGQLVAGLPITDIRRMRDKDPITGAPLAKPRPHKGNDIGADIGTPIKTPFPGTADCTTTTSGAGKYCIFTPDGIKNRQYVILHLDSYKTGHFNAGEEFAKSGNTGLGSGPHIHFEVWFYEDGWYDVTSKAGNEWSFLKGRFPTDQDKLEV